MKFGEARPNTNRLVNIIEGERPLTPLELGLLSWMSDDEVREFAEANEYFLYDDEEEEEESEEDTIIEYNNGKRTEYAGNYEG